MPDEQKTYRVDLSFRGIVDAENEEEAREIAISETNILECYDWNIQEDPHAR